MKTLVTFKSTNGDKLYSIIEEDTIKEVTKEIDRIIEKHILLELTVEKVELITIIK